MSFELTEPRQKTLRAILSRYPRDPSGKMAACLPVLHLAQEQNGWISEEVIDWAARTLELSTSHVLGVATFYSLFNTEPVGEHQVWVCRTLSCALGGAENVLKHCEKRLGIKPGQTTSDGKVTLWTAECLASCGTAPMMQVDREYHENLSIEDVDVILERLTSGGASD